MQENGTASNCNMSSDEEADTHVTFRGESGTKRDRPRWTRLELLLAALCVLLATVSVVLVVIVAAQIIQQEDDPSDHVHSHNYGPSHQGAGQGAGHPYTVVPGGEGPGLSTSQTDHAHATPPEGVCLTQGCVKAAAQLLTAMDPEVDPCEDFFRFACGSWNRLNLIPDDMSHVDNFVVLSDSIQGMLKDLLESPVTSTDLEATRKAKYLYASCTNSEAADRQGLDPVKELLSELGGWPVVEGVGWTGSRVDVGDLVARLRLLDTPVLVNMMVGADDRDSLVNIVQLDQPELGMPSPDYYLKGDDSARFLQVYEDYARQMALQFGADPATARADMHDVVQLEIQLANATTPKAERRDSEKMYNRMSVKRLMLSIPGFDWLGYLQQVFRSVNTEVKDTEEVVVYAPEYFRKMAAIYTTTSKRTLVNYVLWRMVMGHVDHLPRQYRAVKKEYHKTIFGAERDRSRWRECVKYVSGRGVMGDAVGRLFVEKHFDHTSKTTALDMIHNIRHAFYELVEEADWMDEATRVVAIEKAKAVGEHVGYSDDILNDTALNSKYQDVIFSKEHFFDNVVKNGKGLARFVFKRLRQSVDRSQWLTTPTEVNAFYIAIRNSMIIPAAILQPPFYNKEYPKSLNYGGIGMVIGHEITHGFDDRGRQYDKDGNLVQWWDSQVIRRFKDRAQCIIDQYSNFSLPEVDMQVNGIQTQGENIADNGGIKEAYRAYRKWVETQGKEEPRLPGMLQFTHDQLFFINFAQVWCGTMRPEAIIKKLRIGVHSPARFRVIGTLQNQDTFSEAFHCPAHSHMNRPHKCSIW
ncbi:neprilysin-1-like [Babylonia areolata]|uniref:neprilysin-1-like n=1 Tax=Babylonia areolata TaxID=304850 RepID=UPI003FD45833